MSKSNHRPGYDAVGIAKGTGWDCHECGHQNPTGRRDCKRCGHEPVLGRRDVNPEGRRYSTDDEPRFDSHRDEEE